MKKEDCKWQLTWSHDAWKKGDYIDSQYIQTDWNQTLVTRINQISAQIHMTCLRGPADTIYINSETYQLFETFAFFNKSTNILSQRYQIIIDETIDENLIFIVNEKTLSEPIYIPSTTKNVGAKMENGQIETDLGEVSFTPAEAFTVEEVEIYVSKLKGVIEIT